MADDARRDKHAHSSPSHHVGACDEACRAGRRSHAHRTWTDRLLGRSPEEAKARREAKAEDRRFRDEYRVLQAQGRTAKAERKAAAAREAQRRAEERAR